MCVLTKAGHCVGSKCIAMNQADTVLSYGVGMLVNWDGKSMESTGHIQHTRFL